MYIFTYVVFLLLSFTICDGRYLRPIPFSADKGHHIMDEEKMVIFSDQYTGYTAIRDPTFRACFITNYDPEWNLQNEEKQAYVDSKIPSIFHTETDLQIFTLKVGETIGSLCRSLRVYWTNEINEETRMGHPDKRRPPPLSQHNAHRPIFHDSSPNNKPSNRNPPHEFRVPTKRPEFPRRPELPTRRPEFINAQTGVGHVRQPTRRPGHIRIPTRKPEYQGIMAAKHVPAPQPVHGFKREPAPHPIQMLPREHGLARVPRPMLQGLPRLVSKNINSRRLVLEPKKIIQKDPKLMSDISKNNEFKQKHSKSADISSP